MQCLWIFKYINYLYISMYLPIFLFLLLFLNIYIQYKYTRNLKSGIKILLY